jgi:hypothetical protein
MCMGQLDHKRDRHLLHLILLSLQGFHLLAV